MTDAMEALKARFRLRCGDDLLLLKALRDEAHGERLAEFQVRVHRLAGIAGALGYDALGERAKAIDDVLSQNGALASDQMDELAAELDRVAALP